MNLVRKSNKLLKEIKDSEFPCYILVRDNSTYNMGSGYMHHIVYTFYKTENGKQKVENTETFRDMGYSDKPEDWGKEQTDVLYTKLRKKYNVIRDSNNSIVIRKKDGS